MGDMPFDEYFLRMIEDKHKYQAYKNQIFQNLKGKDE